MGLVDATLAGGGCLRLLLRAPPLPSASHFPSSRPCTHSGINRAGGCQEGCHVFDLTWFWSHMFPASGEHSLLPPFVWQGGVQGYWQQFRGLTDTLGTELAACCTGWVEQSFPRQCRLQEVTSLHCHSSSVCLLVIG